VNGRVRRICILEPGSGDDVAKAARGAALWLSGIGSLGWSTLAIVTEATEAERDAMVERSRRQLLAKFGAPDQEAARAAAEEEVAFAAALCDHPAPDAACWAAQHENGEIRERFRTLSRAKRLVTPILARACSRLYLSRNRRRRADRGG